MNITYYNGEQKREETINNLYRDVATLLAKEPISSPKEIEIVDSMNIDNYLKYRISLRSGTRFIVELDNTMPDEYLPKHIEPVVLTCVNPESNAYKSYKLEQIGNQVRATYGRMGTADGELFGKRTYDYPLSMFWIKYYEKISKGYIDRTDVYLANEKNDEYISESSNQSVQKTNANKELFMKLKAFAVKAMKKAEVRVPITSAILKRSEQIINRMKVVQDIEEFNTNLLELIAILQRPIKTGDGSGVRCLMAKDKTDFPFIIQREDDLLQAMKGSYYGNKTSDVDLISFSDYGIEVYEATEKQRKEVMNKLNDTLKEKVSKIYRVIPIEQKNRFDTYLKQNNIKKVKQFWHGSRNQNWTSIIINSLKLNPDAIITGKMFGNGVYFAPSSMKSWNYTSYRGTSWANGNADIAFMGLYATAYGVPKDVDTWNSRTNYKKLMEDAKANCLHAHKGVSLRNDEVIFYHEDAMLLNYIVEFK